jgi:hypothetical protein
MGRKVQIKWGDWYNYAVSDRNKIVVLSLRWTPWNIAHIARKEHEATPEEVEQVVFSSQSIARRALTGRSMIMGETKTGRLLAVVIDPGGMGYGSL